MTTKTKDAWTEARSDYEEEARFEADAAVVECPRCGAMLETDEECPNHEIEYAPRRIGSYEWDS